MPARPKPRALLAEAVALYLRGSPWVVGHRAPTWWQPGTRPPQFSASLITRTEPSGVERVGARTRYFVTRDAARVALARALLDALAARWGARCAEGFERDTCPPAERRCT